MRGVLVRGVRVFDLRHGEKVFQRIRSVMDARVERVVRGDGGCVAPTFERSETSTSSARSRGDLAPPKYLERTTMTSSSRSDALRSRFMMSSDDGRDAWLRRV